MQVGGGSSLHRGLLNPAILHGHNNRAIGLKLGLRTDEVKYHLRGLFSKLGVKRRAAAARQAIERGQVRID